MSSHKGELSDRGASHAVVCSTRRSAATALFQRRGVIQATRLSDRATVFFDELTGELGVLHTDGGIGTFLIPRRVIGSFIRFAEGH